MENPKQSSQMDPHPSDNEKTANLQRKIGCLDSATLEMKFEASKRKFQDYYQKQRTEKKRRTVQVLELCDIPKPETHTKLATKPGKPTLTKTTGQNRQQRLEFCHIPKPNNHMNSTEKFVKPHLVKAERQNHRVQLSKICNVPKPHSCMNSDVKSGKYSLVKKEGQNLIFILKLKT